MQRKNIAKRLVGVDSDFPATHPSQAKHEVIL
jgi:hypothetical protein